MINLIQLVFLAVFVLLSVAFFSLFERKFMGLIQNRKGPNKVGLGLLQPISDAMKLLTKVEMSSHLSSNFMFFLSPIIFFCMSSLFWITFPSFWNLLNFSSSCLFLLLMFSLSVFGLIMSSWFSNSKYATLGGVRAFVQSISYEVGLTLSVMVLCIIISSLSLSDFLNNQTKGFFIFSLSFMLIFLLMIISAELNRSPFDLSEGESELVSGYSVEYGGMSYTILFLSENMSLLWSSVMIGSFFSIYLVGVLIYLFVWIRATVPRIRFDLMINLFWIIMLPLILCVSSIYTSLL